MEGTRGTGAAIQIRPATERDRDAVAAFYRELSPDSRFSRFFSSQAQPPPGLIDREVRSDDDHLTLVAVSEERIVAVASAFRSEEVEVAHFSIAVADVEQGRGLGTRLLAELARRCRRAGYSSFKGETLADNRRMLGAISDVGFSVEPSIERGVISLRFSLRDFDAVEATAAR